MAAILDCMGSCQITPKTLPIDFLYIYIPRYRAQNNVFSTNIYKVMVILMISGGWWQPLYCIIKVYFGGHIGFNGNVMVKSHQ